MKRERYLPNKRIRQYLKELNEDKEISQIKFKIIVLKKLTELKKESLTQWKLQQRDGKFLKEPIRLNNTLAEVKKYTGNQQKTDWI